MYVCINRFSKCQCFMVIIAIKRQWCLEGILKLEGQAKDFLLCRDLLNNCLRKQEFKFVLLLSFTLQLSMRYELNCIATWRVRLSSHLRFLGVNYCMNFSVHAIAKKWVHNLLLNFSVHTIVDQIAGVNVPI